MSELGRVGVIAIGRNEGERLERCLRSIPAGVRVVYVDSASTDGSVAFARAQGAHVIELDMHRPFTAARARREGVKALAAAAPDVAFLQFVDGDCEFEPLWLETACKFLAERPEVAVICGRRRERFPAASFYNELADREWDTPVGQADACGGDAMVRRSAYEGVGGFDPSMVAGEEPELCSRLRMAGWKVWRIDAPMTVHDAAIYRFRQWWLRAVRGGFGYAQVWHKTRRTGAVLYARALARAVFWTIGVALMAAAGVVAFGPLGVLVAPTLWSLQWARLAWRTDPREAALLMAGKAAEALGAARFAFARTLNRRSGTIFYK